MFRSCSFSITYRWFCLVLLALTWWLGAHAQSLAQEKDEKKPTRLIDRQPFDRVTLDAANGGQAIDTLLLELPNRQVPDPLPTNGSLELRQLSEPSTLYNLPWSSIAKVELFEQLLLLKSVELADSGELAEAYEYLDFLHKNYPALENLQVATARYLRREAQTTYADKNYEETLTVLLSLYDLAPEQRGLKNFVETVTDKMITEHLEKRDYAAARSVLDLLSIGFPRLQASNVATWQAKFEKGAANQLSRARKAIDESRFLDARQSLRGALDILPTAAGATEMLQEIDRKSPMMVVGVDQLNNPDLAYHGLGWSATRIAQLTNPKLLNLVGFGAEGGDYECDWAEIASDDTGLILDVKLNKKAMRQGMTASGLALELLRQTDPSLPQFRANFSQLLSSVDVRQGNTTNIRLQRSHVRPEALLPISLRSITSTDYLPGAYQERIQRDDENVLLYQLPKNGPAQRGPKTILEKYYEDEEAALADLIAGNVDILARIPPWQVDRLQQADGVVVSPYRLPTLHVLLPNYKKPIMTRREFRRALCYGIDRQQILSDILLGGESRRGYRVLSGPLPAGITLTDPVGYAYNQSLQPRSYEPRLAAVLSTVARSSLAKKMAAAQSSGSKGSSSSGNDSKGSDTKENDADGSATKADDEQTGASEVEPLVLIYPPTPVATIVCQTLQLQLGAVGIPIKLQRLSAAASEIASGAIPDHDLCYAELALWEPIVDARRLLGPGGAVGYCSSSMSLALQDVDQAKNWKEARSRLKEVHQIAFNDLPVIPLWQTVDFYAHRESLDGIGTTPVSLYQSIRNWRRISQGGRR